MLSKICCLHTDLCKCHCFGLTRNKNVKIGYLLLLAFFAAALFVTNTVMDPASPSTIQHYGC
jgi:hypothetical protein